MNSSYPQEDMMKYTDERLTNDKKVRNEYFNQYDRLIKALTKFGNTKEAKIHKRIRDAIYADVSMLD